MSTRAERFGYALTWAEAMKTAVKVREVNERVKVYSYVFGTERRWAWKFYLSPERNLLDELLGACGIDRIHESSRELYSRVLRVMENEPGEFL